VTGGWKWLYAVNPMAGVIDSLRWSVLGGPAPGPELLVSLASCLALLAAGVVYFASAERRFADVI
jgi:lipopolysaccharide transport system permease protein